MYLITGQHPTDSEDARYHYDVSSLQKDGPPRGATDKRGNHEDGDGTVPTGPSVSTAVVISTATTTKTTPQTTHTPTTTTSDGTVIDSTTSSTVVSTSDVTTTTTTRPYSTSSVSSTASGSFHVDSEVHGTDQRTTASSVSTNMISGTATSDRSATHSHSTISVSNPNTTTQSGKQWFYLYLSIYFTHVCNDINSPTRCH